MPTTTLPLGPELTIPYAGEAQATLAQALQAGDGTLVLDLSAVAEFDSAGVQLLLATRRSLAERGLALQIARPSDVVQDALRVFGLTPLFEAAA
ncbi:MAG: STAS domain-containing protein [Rubrivivax sp.]|nr:STAS domain-containing protein [Rubrivivax sp.]